MTTASEARPPVTPPPGAGLLTRYRPVAGRAFLAGPGGTLPAEGRYLSVHDPADAGRT